MSEQIKDDLTRAIAHGDRLRKKYGGDGNVFQPFPPMPEGASEQLYIRDRKLAHRLLRLSVAAIVATPMELGELGDVLGSMLEAG